MVIVGQDFQEDSELASILCRMTSQDAHIITQWSHRCSHAGYGGRAIRKRHWCSIGHCLRQRCSPRNISGRGHMEGGVSVDHPTHMLL